MADIFSPIKVKGVEFRNRIVMAPMVRFGFPSEDGVMGEELVNEYLGYTGKGIGLTIMQAMFVAPSFSDLPWVCLEKNMPPLQRIVEESHEKGDRIFAQILLNGEEVVHKGGVNGLSPKDIGRVRDCFVRSAARLKKAGFDGVELHGAHELFLNQVASGVTNKRSDKYGGDLQGRLMLAREIIEDVKSFAGDDFILSYRMGVTFDRETDFMTAKALESFGLDMLHVSYGISEKADLAVPQSFGDYDAVVYAGCGIRKQVGIPVIVVSGIQTLNRGNALVERDDCEFVAYGRPFLADPGFVVHSREDMDYNVCFGCKICQWNNDHSKCPARKRLGLGK